MPFSVGKILFFIRNLIGFRPNDILLTSFPRAGSTWIRFILCNYLSLQEMAGQPVDLQVLDDIMPTLNKSNLTKTWPYQSLPRIIKTHQPYRPVIFRTPRRIAYILRDPRDVMVSYYYFLQNHTQRAAPSEFAAFLRHESYGLAACMQHYLSWRPYIDVTLQYEDLKLDANAAMLAFLDALQIPIRAEDLQVAVARSNFKEMRTVLEQKGLSNAERFDPGFRVVRSGTTQEWVKHFSETDVIFYGQLRDRLEFELYP